MVVAIMLFGLVVGSFLNVIILRVPLHRSIVSPPSTCMSCGTRIKMYDNIPVLSWLMLRGRCRTCKSWISRRYIFIELNTALFFGIVAEKFPTNAPFLLIAFLVLAASTIALALIDFDTHTLPDKILLPSICVGAWLLTMDEAVTPQHRALLRALFGLCTLALFYFSLTLIYPGGMGMGDVKFAGLLGFYLAYLGWEELLVATFFTFILAALFALALIYFRGANRKTEIPFGPWMVTGSWIGIIFGATIFNQYLSLFGLAHHVS